MSNPITKKLESMAQGLVCLVPRKEVGGITCHEKTLCDCEVLTLISALKVASEALEFYSGNFDGRDGTKWNGDTFFIEDKFGCSQTAYGGEHAKKISAEILKLLNGGGV